MEFKDKLKQMRLAAGLTQKELAERAGLATGTVQQYELGKRRPNYEALNKIEDALCEFFPGYHRQDILYGVELTVKEGQEFLDHYYDPPAQMTREEKLKSRLLDSCNHLNTDGISIVTDIADGLTNIPKYQKEKSRESQQIEDLQNLP